MRTATWDFRRRRFVPEGLPLATHGTRLDDRAIRREVSVLPDGDVRFRGGTWSFTTGEADARARSEAALLSWLAHACDDVVSGFPASACAAPPLFKVSGHAPLATVARLWRAAMAGHPTIDRIQWAVDGSAFGPAFGPGWVAQEAGLAPLVGTAPVRDEAALRIRLAPGAGTEAGTRITVEGATGPWSIAPTPFYGASSAATLPTWDAVHAALAAEARRSGSVVIETAEAARIPWEVVARVLDGILGTPLRTVDLSDQGIRLVLADAEPLRNDAELFPDDPVVTLPAILGAALVMLLAFAATYAPLRRRRHRRRRATAELPNRAPRGGGGVR